MAIQTREHWGDRLAFLLRTNGNLKQLVLATALQVEESTISRWISGGNVSLAHLIDLCEFFDVSLDWLALGKGDFQSHKIESQNSPLGQFPDSVRVEILMLFDKLSVRNEPHEH